MNLTLIKLYLPNPNYKRYFKRETKENHEEKYNIVGVRI